MDTSKLLPTMIIATDKPPNQPGSDGASEISSSTTASSQQSTVDPEILDRLKGRIAKDATRYETLVVRYERVKKVAEEKHEGERKAKKESSQLAQLVSTMKVDITQAQKSRDETDSALQATRKDLEQVIRLNHTQLKRIADLEQELQKQKWLEMNSTQIFQVTRHRIDRFLATAEQKIMEELDVAVGKLDNVKKEETKLPETASLKRDHTEIEGKADASPHKKLVVQDPRLVRR